MTARSTPGSSCDIDELRESLAESNSRFTALVERAGYGIYRSSRAGRFVEANSALASMLGYASPDELLRLDLARDVYLDPQERGWLIKRAIAHAYADWIETRWKRRDGSPIIVRLSVRPTRGADGEIESYDGIVDDVTERQRHDELLRRSERLATLGTTLAGVAHELNNPLAAIMGFAQLLLKKPWPAEDRAALETINHEAVRTASIVKDLLVMTRKRDVERRARADVNDVVGYIVRTRRYALETAGITCTLDLDPAIPMVRGDRAELEQVILNLINNSEHALRSRVDDTPPQRQPVGGAIRIRTSHDARFAIIEFEDSGPGIPESAQSQIWDPFWTTKAEGEGTGLGLALVHGIVADHGGTISVGNVPGSGARFVIRLPVAAESVLPARTGQASRPLDVLVVDPGASDLMFIERFLISRGHAVTNAGSGELAVRLASQTTFDAVVCDARLLGGDSIPVAAALRATSGCADARFVLSTPEATEGREAMARLAGALENAAVVLRPYDVEELRRLIEGE
jgi:PAS domain S-box-containing protein